jgi:hypothetical protein
MIMRNCKLWSTALIGLSLIFAWLGCSNKGVETDNNAASVSMNLKITSPDMIDAIDQFRVIVTAGDIDPPIVAPLLLIGQYLEGIVLVPSGEGRVFTVEASDVDGVLLYQGVDTVNIVAQQVVELTIGLKPVISLVRVSPRYLEVPASSQFFVDVTAFNVSELYGITFRLHWQGSVVFPDSAKSLLPQGREILWIERLDTFQQFYEIGLSSADQVTLLVDASGDADLVRFLTMMEIRLSHAITAELMVTTSLSSTVSPSWLV